MAEYLEQRRVLIEYLLMKAKQEDWHGVRDCAADIELLDARERGRNERRHKNMHPVPSK